MCGRFVSTSSPSELATYFDALTPTETTQDPDYNVAPTSDILVVRVDADHRQISSMHWGLVPFWAKDPSIGSRMINARAEGLAEKNAFKRSFRTRRCIVPVDGFYEWKTLPGQKAKQPYFIHRPDHEPLAFAGLWDEWRRPDSPSDDLLRSTTMITTTPNDAMSVIHHRMPVILPPTVWDQWLDPDNSNVEELQRLLVPAPSEIITMHPVSREVGNVRNQGPHLIDPVDPDVATHEPQSATLFG